MARQKSLFRIIIEPLIVALVLAFAVRSCIGIYSVPSASMSPALQPGDRIVVTRMPGGHAERNDVVVFRDPADRSRLSVKRVIGLPGDLVESGQGHVLVPRGHLFVLGDNRQDSWDSRHWGPLPADLVVGRARVVLWQGRGRRIFKWIE